ncbi:hypothetical protein [Nocardia testacea]|uniref:Alpha/beta hydrolase n=1 Tax=Nocardia testacea TaxID=248551 RepID=A0ABW7VTN4_9NOCA
MPERIPADLREALIRAYPGTEALGGGFTYYRAMPENTRLIAAAVADDLVGRLIPDCGHIIPLDRPDALLAEVVPFLH